MKFEKDKFYEENPEMLEDTLSESDFIAIYSAPTGFEEDQYVVVEYKPQYVSNGKPFALFEARCYNEFHGYFSSLEEVCSFCNTLC